MSVSLTHINKVPKTPLKWANRATNVMFTRLNSPKHSMYNSPTHQVIHKEQEKGFGILTLPFNHLLNDASTESIIPLISMINTIISVIKNKSMHISNSVIVLWFSLSYYAKVYVNNPVVKQLFFHS